jgi:hypothetical protein
MPIDPQIPLSVKPFNVDAVGALGRAIQLKQLGQRGRLQEQQIAENEQQMKARQADREETQLLGDIVQKNIGPDGAINYKGVMSDLAKSGQPHALLRFRDLVAQMPKADWDTKDAAIKAQMTANSAVAAEFNAATTPEAFETAKANVKARYGDTLPAMAAAMDALGPYTPEKQQQILATGMSAQGWLGHLSAMREQPSKEADARQKVRAEAAAQLGAATDGAQYADILKTLPPDVARAFPSATGWTAKTTPERVRLAGMTAVQQDTAEHGRDRKAFQSLTVMVGGKQTLANFDPATGKYYDAAGIEIPNAQPEPSAAQSAAARDAADTTDLTPAGLEAAALNYAKTGQLPALGNGDKQTRKKIINRAAALMPGLDLATARADYDANRSSETSMQKQLDAVTAFEDTALKNLDQFIATAKKVTDTGSPLLNTPLRLISDKMLGSPDMAAYNVARRTVIPEFAKILNNPTLSGQLSDSARHEIEGLMDGNVTLKQVLATATILKQDTKNRRTALSDQLAGIRARIQKGAPTPVAPRDTSTPGAGGNGATVTVTSPSGKTYHFKTQAEADAAVAAATAQGLWK